METKLKRITEIAKIKPKERFTSLVHLIDETTLKQCHKELKANRASGVDGITKAEYEENLDENISSLVQRLKKQTYKPEPVKRVYIPKPGSEEKRPLGIPSYEDKLVQLAISKILNAIYDNSFVEDSYGFRPGRGCHDALKKLDYIIQSKKVSYVIDEDIKGFFNNVSHKWIVRFLEYRIADRNLIRLIVRFLVTVKFAPPTTS